MTLYTTSLAEAEVCHWLKEKEDEDKSSSSRCHLKGHRRWCYPLYLYSGLPDLPIPRYGSPFNALQRGPGSRSFRFHGQDREWCCLPIYLSPLNYRGANASNARTQVILDNQSDETQRRLTQARFIALQNLGPQHRFPGLWYPLNYMWSWWVFRLNISNNKCISIAAVLEHYNTDRRIFLEWLNTSVHISCWVVGG